MDKSRVRAIAAEVAAERDMPVGSLDRIEHAIMTALKEALSEEPSEAMYAAANREWDGRMSTRSAGVWEAMASAKLVALESRRGG